MCLIFTGVILPRKMFEPRKGFSVFRLLFCGAKKCTKNFVVVFGLPPSIVMGEEKSLALTVLLILAPIERKICASQIQCNVVTIFSIESEMIQLLAWI